MIILQDELFDFEDMTEFEDDTIFGLKPLQARSYEKDKVAQADIVIEMSTN